MSSYLAVEVAQTLGELSLQAEFALSSPWTVLFGPSGAGKTSLLRILSGLSRPRQGRIVLRDRALLDTARDVYVPPAARSIGFATQQPSLFPNMDVTANVAFGLAGSDLATVKERVSTMLALFQASHLAARKPADLSGGEKQRVALARALAPEPSLLLLDEPFSGLDADLKAGILETLTAWLAKRNIPALYVSHDVVEAFQTEADVLVMNEGKIEAHGPASAVLAEKRELLLRQLRKH